MRERLEAGGFRFRCSHTDDIGLPCRRSVKHAGYLCGNHYIWNNALKALPLIPPTFTQDWHTMINELNVIDREYLTLHHKEERKS